MIPKSVTDRLQRHRTSQVTSVGGTETPLSGIGKPSTCNIQFLHVCSRARRDEESSLLAETLVQSVYRPMFCDFDSELGTSRGERMLAPWRTK